jgi:succinyl-CoA synthetase beta subunit
MQLHEFQAKEILREHGISRPRGSLARNVDEVRAAAAAIGGPVMVKAQVLAGGRGKAGGIRPAADADEAVQIFRDLSKATVRGFRVEQVLIEEQLPIAAEYYVGVTINTKAGSPLFILSTSGGIDIEASSQSNRDSVARRYVLIEDGLTRSQAKDLVRSLDIPENQHEALIKICLKLYKTFADCGAMLAEINPLAILADGRLAAADARINADDAFVPTVPFLAAIKDERLAVPSLVNEFQKHGIQYVPMGGNIGVISTGAGATLAICDWIAERGGRAFGWLDVVPALVAGGFKKPAMIEAIRYALAKLDGIKDVDAILINSIAGGLSVQLYAEAVCEVVTNGGRPRQPFVVHVGGNGEETGRASLAQAGLPFETTLERAVERVVGLSKGLAQ